MHRPQRREGIFHRPSRKRELCCVRNSSRKGCPMGLHAALAKGHLPDTDKVIGGIQERWRVEPSRRETVWTPTGGSRRKGKWQSRVDALEDLR